MTIWRTILQCIFCNAYSNKYFLWVFVVWPVKIRHYPNLRSNLEAKATDAPREVMIAAALNLCNKIVQCIVWKNFKMIYLMSGTP